MDKIICLGKNYDDHIKEMKDLAPERPVLFIKPPSVLHSLSKENELVLLPWARGEIHHECEIVFKLYKKNIIGVALGLDLTLREVQRELKTKGHPWEISKVFKNSAIVSEFKSQRDFNNWQTTPFELKVNGETRQASSLENANYKADSIIHYINDFFPLSDGDLVFTGTPSGVGPLKTGDVVELIWGPIHNTFRLG